MATKSIPANVISSESKALLRLWSDRRFGISQDAFGAEFGIGSQGMVWQYLHGHRALNLKAALGFAKGLGCAVSEFSPRLSELLPQSLHSQGGSDADDGSKYVYVPKYDAKVSAGNGRINDHVEISGTHAYRRDWLLKNGWSESQLAVVEAVGDSMKPTINDGDVVLINLSDTSIVSGLVYALHDPIDGTRIKRLFRLMDGRICVRSDADDKRLYPDDYLTPHSQTRVIGRVVHRSGSV